MKENKINFVFFGTTEFSVIVLEELLSSGLKPVLVVTVPDKPKGRSLTLTPPPVKIWAQKNNVPVIQPQSLKGEEVAKLIESYSTVRYDLFIVFSYSKIIPQNILDIPAFGCLNLHPSLLPKLRGPSPIKTAILTEDETGLSIIKMDSQMDHGPVILQEKIEVSQWPPYEEELENKLADEGGKLLAKIIPQWITGEVSAIEQDHTSATFTKMIEKEDGQISLEDDPEKNLRKIRAFHIWPGAYYFEIKGDSKIRVIIKKARIENDKLIIETVVPEGKKEMDYADFKRGLRI